MEQTTTKRIAYIGNFGADWNEEGNAKAIEKLGIQVLRLEENEFIFDRDVAKITKFSPDLILFAKLKLMVMRDVFVREMKKKYKTACWTFDLYFGLRREKTLKTDPVFKADYVFSPDGGHDKEFKEKGINHYLLRQGIHEDYCFKGTYKKEYDHDVIFVGSENYQWPSRTELCFWLQKTYGNRFHWYGRLNTLEIRGTKLNDLYASAKIVIGDSVYSPNYWSNRLYETLGRGGFLLFPEILGLDKEYTPYKHYIPFKFDDYRGLKEKIDYFLTKPAERLKIANSAFEHTKNNHTLNHRVKTLIDIIDRNPRV